MSYTLVSDKLHSNPSNGGVEMTQINPITPNQPEPVLPSSVPVIDSSELAHISLHQAARDGRADVVEQRLFKFSRHPHGRVKALNKLDEDKVSPLHYAVRYGHNNVTKLLVDNGADVNIQGEDGATPLHYAARFRASKARQSISRLPSLTEDTNNDPNDDKNIGSALQLALLQVAGSDETLLTDEAVDDEDESIIDYLLSKKANVNFRDSYGLTPLHYAANKCNAVATRELLRCEEIKVDERDSGGGTALQAACNEGAVDVVRALVDAGADIRAKDFESMTPLHFACTEGHLDTVKLLTAAGEKIGGQDEVKAMMADKNRDMEVAIHGASDGGYLEVVKLCIECGANVRAARNNRAQPLHLAAISGQVEIGKLLIAKGANIEARDGNHETPLHKAASFARVQFLQYLLAKGANIESRDKDNFTPLLSASCSGHTTVITALMGRGANMKAKDIHDRTAIFMAAEENCVDTLKELVKHSSAKGLINESNFYEDTPLHMAAMKGFVVVSEILLDNGARIDAHNEEEFTPLHLAAKHGRMRTVEALVKRDPSIVNDEDEFSNTPLHLAALEGHNKCVMALLEHGAAVDARNYNLWTPLDCAAANGYVKCASILLDFDSPVDPTDRTKTTPLHLASRMDHVDVVVLLLSRNADITLTDHTGRNCLDMAVDHGQKEVASAIVSDKNWMDAMKNKTLEQGKVTTPMRKLIEKLPDVAEIVLNNCVTDNGLPLHHPDYKVYMNYEYVEDLYSDWSLTSSSTLGSDSGSVHSLALEKERSEYGFQMIDEGNIEVVTKQLEKKSNHPLMIMVKRKREKLLSHPLISFLLDRKWRTYGRYVYYIKLFIYCVLLCFLTGYSITTTESLDKKTAGTCSVLTSTTEKLTYKLWVTFGSVVIIILAGWHILMELFQLVYNFFQYFGWENLLEWTVYVSAIVYVAPEFEGSDSIGFSKCANWNQSVGAVSIFSAWMSLLLFIRKFPKLGIYVVMFTDILYTFTKFSLIFVLFIIAFALSFFTLFSGKDEFNSAGRSLVKTGVMMIGEFEFDSLFDSKVPVISWVLFVIFLIVMTLILMNLLIGLAVDDIKGVQDQAVLKRQAMLVDLALDVEKAMPRRLRKHLAIPSVETFQPNQHRGIFWYFNQPAIRPQEMKEALELEKSPMQKLEEQNEELMNGMRSMKMRMKDLQLQQEQLQAMLKAVVKKLEATVDDDADEEEAMFINSLFK